MDESEIHIDENQLAACIDWIRKTGEEPPPDVRDHLENCDQCRRAVLELSAVLDEVDRTERSDETGLEHPAREFGSRLLIRRSLLRWAAILAGVLVVAWAIDRLRREAPQPELSEERPVADSTGIRQLPDPVSGEDTTVLPAEDGEIWQPVHDTIRFAANFAPNAEWEILVNSRFRAGDGTETGRPEMIFRQHETFIPEADSVPGTRLTLMNNGGSELGSWDYPGWTAGIRLNWDPGLYYWKLTRETGLLAAGRFTLYSAPDQR